MHRFFVDWFTGAKEQEQNVLDVECGNYFSDDFTMVTPSGSLLVNKPVLLQKLFQAHGTHANTGFEIEIEDCKVLQRYGENLALVAYLEIQRHQASSSAETTTTTRQSTALLERTTDSSGKILWRHVHETWVEGKSPKQQ